MPRGGSSAPPSEPYATNIARSLSKRSVNSNDSDYLSENVHHVSRKLHYIPEGKAEESVGFRLHDLRKASAGNRDRALSLRSFSSKYSSYSSNDAHSSSKNPAVIFENRIDEITDFGLFQEKKNPSQLATLSVHLLSSPLEDSTRNWLLLKIPQLSQTSLSQSV